MVQNYPRGHKSLRGPFSRFNASDTITWFENHGVELKTEADGRMFPSSNISETIVHCLTDTAQELGIETRTRTKVTRLEKLTNGYAVHLSEGAPLITQNVLIATGGLRGAEARQVVRDAEHEFTSPVASLFTFHIDDERLDDLQGVSVPHGMAQAAGYKTEGPILITHWGLSGPGILKLSAWAARELSETQYQFPLIINWTGSLNQEQVQTTLNKEREAHSTRQIHKRSLIEGITARLWSRLCEAAAIHPTQTWANLTKKQTLSLVSQLTAASFQVTGKSTNKDEFVTCGGVKLKDLNLKTMESKAHPGLYFAGEVLDIDGVTGGFNFQAAWTTGFLAGRAIAEE